MPTVEHECVERIRGLYLGQSGHDGVEAGLAGRIAADVAAQCGVTRLKAHRLARGWSVTRAVDAFHAMCRHERIKPRGLTVRSWMEWESGGRPGFDYQDLVSRLMQTSAVQLGWATDYSPSGHASPGSLPALATALPAATAANPHGTWPGIRRRSLLHLPPDIPDFTGRADTAGQVRRLIVAGERSMRAAPPVVCLSGQGGTGKTALAVHVAHQVRGDFPDGQLYANLRRADSSPRDPADVLAALLRELEVDGGDIPEGLGERASLYRAQLAGLRILVVLDDAADEAQVRPLLPGSGESAVLVTSRSRLTALTGSHCVSLGVLPPDHAAGLLAAITGAGRAEAEPEAVAEIARLCGRLPLALRIAGARLVSRPAWTISWFAGELGDESKRLDLLQVGDLEVRASFRLSYDHRPDAEQFAFRMLGLLPADFPAWALAAILGTDEDDAERLLEKLLNWNDDQTLGQVVSNPGTGNSATSSYVYDASGSLLLQKDAATGTQDAATTLYLPGEQLTLDTKTGAITGDRFLALPGGGQVVRTGADTTSGTPGYYYQLSDQHGTATLAVGPALTAAQATWREFTPYGAPRGTTVTWIDNRGFLGKPADTVTGLTNVGARWYDPATGTFQSIDPVFEATSPQQHNGYTYAAGNPVTGSDPTGLQTLPCDGQCGTAGNGTANTGDGGSGGSGGTAGTANTGDGGTPSGGSGSGPCFHDSCLTGGGNPGPRLQAVATPPAQALSPTQQPGCTPMLFKFGACPSEAGLAGTTPQEVEQSFRLAGIILLSSVLGPFAGLGDLGAASGAGVAAEDAAPDLAAYAGGKTSGVLVRADGSQVPLESGYDGPALDLSKPRPGMNGNIVSHVEAHAAAIMRSEGLDDATLYINRMPCGGANGCMLNVSRMVPSGSTLNIYVMPQGSAGTFEDWINVTGTG
jgi:RHS repeat-associated protein